MERLHLLINLIDISLIFLIKKIANLAGDHLQGDHSQDLSLRSEATLIDLVNGHCSRLIDATLKDCVRNALNALFVNLIEFEKFTWRTVQNSVRSGTIYRRCLANTFGRNLALARSKVHRVG